MDVLATTTYTSLLEFLLSLCASNPGGLETRFTTIKAGKLHIQVANDSFGIASREPGRKEKGSAPSREPNDRYNGGAADRLNNERVRRVNVPKGLRDAGSGGGGRDGGDRRDNSGGGSNGAGGGGNGGRGGGNGGGDGGGTTATISLEELKETLEDLRAGQGQNQKKVVQQLHRIIAQLSQRNWREASKPTFSTNLYTPEARVVRPNLDSELRLYISKSGVCIAFQYLHIKDKASAPSRMPNESYNGGSLDGLFKGANGGVGVPKGLRDAAGNGDGGDEQRDDSVSGGGSGGSGGGGGGGDDDGDEGDDGDEADVTMRDALAYPKELAKNRPPLTQELLERQQREIHMGCCKICQGLQTPFTAEWEGGKVCDGYRR